MYIEINIPSMSESQYLRLVDHVRKNGRVDAEDIVYLYVVSGGRQSGEAGSRGHYHDVTLGVDDCCDEGKDFEAGWEKAEEILRGLSGIFFSSGEWITTFQKPLKTKTLTNFYGI